MKKSMMPLVVLTGAMSAVPAAALTVVFNDAGAVATQLAEIKAQFKIATDDVKQSAEKALAEAKRNGDLTNETKQVADKALAVFNDLSQKHDKLTQSLEALETKHRDVEQELTQRRQHGPAPVMSLGQSIAKDEGLKQYVAGGLSGSKVITVKNAITTAGGSGGGLIFPTQDRDVGRMARRTLSVLALITRGATDSSLVSYSRQTTRTNAAAPTAETAAAPQSSYGWTRAEANVRKIAHVAHVSDETLADAAALQTEVDTEMRYGVELALENQIVAGAGTGENLAGLKGAATTFAAASGLPNSTRIDRLRLALLQLSLAGYSGNGVLLNDVDWAAIELLKDTTGRYVYGSPFDGAASPRLWNLDVSATLGLSAGEWIVGNFALASTFYLRSDVEVQFSTENDTNFVDGLVTAKATVRGALAHKRPAAIVKGDFTFA